MAGPVTVMYSPVRPDLQSVVPDLLTWSKQPDRRRKTWIGYIPSSDPSLQESSTCPSCSRPSAGWKQWDGVGAQSQTTFKYSRRPSGTRRSGGSSASPAPSSCGRQAGPPGPPGVEYKFMQTRGIRGEGERLVRYYSGPSTLTTLLREERETF